MPTDGFLYYNIFTFLRTRKVTAVSPCVGHLQAIVSSFYKTVCQVKFIIVLTVLFVYISLLFYCHHCGFFYCLEFTCITVSKNMLA